MMRTKLRKDSKLDSKAVKNMRFLTLEKTNLKIINYACGHTLNAVKQFEYSQTYQILSSQHTIKFAHM